MNRLSDTPLSGRFGGLGVALITPFTADGAVDVAALKRLTHSQIDGGVDYLVPMGTTAESATLTAGELQQAVEVILEENAGQLPVLLGCGGNDTLAVAQKLTEYTRKWPVDGFLSVSPYYNRPTQEGIYQHYKYLLDYTDKPFVIYNVPPRTGSNMTAETTLRLAHDFPRIVAVKEASGSLEQSMDILQHKPEGFSVLSGDDLLAFPGIALGFDGLISVIGNALPTHTSRLVHLALSQDMAGARILHSQLKPLMQLIFREGNPAGVKALLECLRITGPQVRLPLVAASSRLRQDLEAALAALPQLQPA
ncbi:MAG: 4-hydroxy-tetrahydrodipicolinate synthase [Bacteroidetes bacterium]|nr:4-hydroxy-tetrahydrodipicolinate synthase [Bacteroidota bacterium]